MYIWLLERTELGFVVDKYFKAMKTETIDIEIIGSQEQGLILFVLMNVVLDMGGKMRQVEA